MARILVLGSIARDEVVRLRQPLDAGRHLEGRCAGARLGGGAACTGVPLVHAGHQVSLVGAVGTDAYGDELLAELQTSGVDTSQLRRLETPTTRSMILVDEAGERTVVNLFRAREPEPPARILDLAADGLYVRSRALDLAPLLAEKVRSCLVVAHVPPCQPGARPAQVLLASEADLEGVPESPWDWGRGIAGEVLRWVVLTRGPDGAVAFGADQRHEARPPRVDARDTTGAGDAFAAGLIHALVSGTPIPAALEIGCSWGAAKAARDGSVLDRDIVAGLL